MELIPASTEINGRTYLMESAVKSLTFQSILGRCVTRRIRLRNSKCIFNNFNAHRYLDNPIDQCAEDFPIYILCFSVVQLLHFYLVRTCQIYNDNEVDHSSNFP